MIKLLRKYSWHLFLCALFITLISFSAYPYLKKDSPDIYIRPTTISPAYKEIIQWITARTTWHQQGTDAGWAGFDKVYFITMPKRLDNVRQIAERLGISDSAWIFNAIYKDSLDLNELIALNMVDKNYLDILPPRRYGCIGCQLSHLAVMLDCYRDPNAQTCVIFEDDLYKPAKDVTAQIIDFRKRVEKLEIDWDILYLDYCSELGGGKTEQDVRWLNGCGCGHAYVIKKSTVPVILAASLPMHEPIDGTYQHLAQNKRIIAIGPDKTRYFAQNKLCLGSTIDPGFLEDSKINLRFM